MSDVPETLHPATAFWLQFFTFDHLQEDLRPIAASFAGLAVELASVLPSNQSTTEAIKALVQVKDHAVRAIVAARAPVPAAVIDSRARP
jgi:hypothetical protein